MGDLEAKRIISEFEIDYSSRKDSHIFLEDLKKTNQISVELESFNLKKTCKQDVYFFRNALKTFDEFSNDFGQGFCISILNRVKLIYTEVNPQQARRVFSMMNQGKAFMKATELIKAAFLSVASRSEIGNEGESIEWEINEVRSRFSREWNQWEQWWRSEKVKLMFGSNDIEYLLRLFFINFAEYKTDWKWVLGDMPHAKEVEKYNTFKEYFLSSNQDAKLNFQKLRKLQQQMEQLVSSPETYNYLALILNIAATSKTDLVNYFKDKDWKTIKAKVPYFLLNPKVNLSDVISQIDFKNEAFKLIQKLNGKYVYDKDVFDETGKQVFGAYEEMCRMLLWMNVEEELNLTNKGEANRYFNFKIWEKGNRTLEHIYPKSLSTDLDFSNYKEFDYLTVHSAGNLVLLYHNENSKFGAKSPSEKKEIYFDFTNEFKSRHLMHSIMVFAKRDEWKVKEIIGNQKEFISKVTQLYFGNSDNFLKFEKTLKSENNE